MKIDDNYRAPETEKERVIILQGYCKGNNGAREYSVLDLELCSHPECSGCRDFEDLLNKEIEKYISKTEG